MKSNQAYKNFITIGFILTLVSLALAFVPQTMELDKQFQNTTPNKSGDNTSGRTEDHQSAAGANAGYGSIGMAIIAATCFFVAGQIVIQANRNGQGS